ncbi:MAG: hypothetical protein GXP08_13835, partial [Gammaproteobacteria bacterium]|nr:hypothetical protein [Gammaproteobacteria bacterium]
YKPRYRNDNQNFYPGEALLYWATKQRLTPNNTLLTKIYKSFHYYKTWHRQNRNPAFIPWHTQAYYLLWTMTHDAELKKFIFEMNDWLLNMQQWDNVVYDDTKGRYYNPEHQGYGPPHASSTGVYLEGLVDAYKLARQTNNNKRAQKYKTAIVRGLRSIMQLQYADEVDMYYIFKRDQVYGGIRSRVYDNTIRIDNIQHSLMAVLKVLDTFSEEDFIVSH